MTTNSNWSCRVSPKGQAPFTARAAICSRIKNFISNIQQPLAFRTNELTLETNEEYKRAISSIYCIDRADHFLKLAPYEWLSLIETQVTKGLAYFLNSGNESQNRSRVQTLVSAIGIPSKVENQSVEAEFRNNDNTRIDLIIKWEDGAMRNQITIEAKLNYELRKNQLRSYLKNTKKKKRKIRQLLFLCYFWGTNPNHYRTVKRKQLLEMDILEFLTTGIWEN